MEAHPEQMPRSPPALPGKGTSQRSRGIGCGPRSLAVLLDTSTWSLLLLFLINGPLAPKTPCQDTGVNPKTTFSHRNSASQGPSLDHLPPALPRLGEDSQLHNVPSGRFCHLLVIQKKEINCGNSDYREYKPDPTVRAISRKISAVPGESKPPSLEVCKKPLVCKTAVLCVTQQGHRAWGLPVQNLWHNPGGRTWLHKEVAVLTQTGTCLGNVHQPCPATLRGRYLTPSRQLTS